MSSFFITPEPIPLAELLLHALGSKRNGHQLGALARETMEFEAEPLAVPKFEFCVLELSAVLLTTNIFILSAPFLYAKL